MDENNFDLNDPDTFAFDETPDEFVLFTPAGPVFTVRGIAHFTPRFERVGFDVAKISTKEEFDCAYHAWTCLEVQLLTDSIGKKASSSHQSNQHQVLFAAITQGFEAAEAAAKRLAHKNRAKLSSIK
jgi:hypothetical protein